MTLNALGFFPASSISIRLGFVRGLMVLLFLLLGLKNAEGPVIELDELSLFLLLADELIPQGVELSLVKEVSMRRLSNEPPVSSSSSQGDGGVEKALSTLIAPVLVKRP